MPKLGIHVGGVNRLAFYVALYSAQRSACRLVCRLPLQWLALSGIRLNAFPKQSNNHLQSSHGAFS